MAFEDSIQVKLAIVEAKNEATDFRDGSAITGGDILKQMDKNGVWRKDDVGKYVIIQYSGREYRFRPGKLVTVPKNIGDALVRSSHILVGNKSDILTNPDVPYLVVRSQHVLGAEDAPAERSLYECELCGKDCKTLPRKARHYADAHKNDPRYTGKDSSDGGDEATSSELETQEA